MKARSSPAPLHLAVNKGLERVVTVLLAKGVQKDDNSEGYNALMLACVSVEPNLAIVEKLVTAGADVNYTQKNLRSTESGLILIYGNKRFTMSEKALVPAMGISATKENYDSPYVYEFFKTSRELMAGRHIVGGQVSTSSSLVRTHAQQYESMKKTIEADITKKKRKRNPNPTVF